MLIRLHILLIENQPQGIVFLGSNLVSWHLRKQHIVSRSSTKAGYRSLVNLTTKLSWLQSLLFELSVPNDKTPIVWCDNLSTVMLA